MRDWSKLRRASFRGIPFWVDSDGPEGGRRVAVHDISGGETPVVEDMGRVSKTISVSAYVVSDLADLQGAALEAACDEIGPAALVLPIDPFQMVVCQSCRRNRRKDENGYIAFDLTFVEAGDAGLASVSGIGALRSVFEASLSSIAQAMGKVF